MARSAFRAKRDEAPKMGQGKVGKVLHEWKAGTLRSSSGQTVTNRRQALAIALSEAGLSRKKKKKRR